MAKNTIRTVLDEHGKSQTDLAHVAGVSVPYVNMVCLEKVTPAPKTKGKIVMGLNELTSKNYNLEEIFP